jgi:hypothetical protein
MLGRWNFMARAASSQTYRWRCGVSIELSDDDWREPPLQLDRLHWARRFCIDDGDIKESCRYDNRSREVEKKTSLYIWRQGSWEISYWVVRPDIC